MNLNFLMKNIKLDIVNIVWNNRPPLTWLRSSPRVNPNTNRRYSLAESAESTPASTEWSWSIDWRSVAWLLQSCLESKRRLAGQRDEIVRRLRRDRHRPALFARVYPTIRCHSFSQWSQFFRPLPRLPHPLWPEGRSPQVWEENGMGKRRSK